MKFMPTVFHRVATGEIEPEFSRNQDLADLGPRFTLIMINASQRGAKVWSCRGLYFILVASARLTSSFDLFSSFWMGFRMIVVS